MGELREVIPRPGSYVNEWRAIQYAIGDWQSVKRLLRPIGYLVFVELADDDGPVLVMRRGDVTFRIREDEWVVISPHDKVIIMETSTYELQFIEVT